LRQLVLLRRLRKLLRLVFQPHLPEMDDTFLQALRLLVEFLKSQLHSNYVQSIEAQAHFCKIPLHFTAFPAADAPLDCLRRALHSIQSAPHSINRAQYFTSNEAYILSKEPSIQPQKSLHSIKQGLDSPRLLMNPHTADTRQNARQKLVHGSSDFADSL